MSWAWEIVTSAMAILLLVKLLDELQLGPQPFQEKLMELTLHGEKIGIFLLSVCTVLASKWTVIVEALVLFLAVIRQLIAFARNYVQLAWRVVGWAVIFLSAANGAVSFPGTRCGQQQPPDRNARQILSGFRQRCSIV
jgi:hypothetical protein